MASRDEETEVRSFPVLQAATLYAVGAPDHGFESEEEPLGAGEERATGSSVPPVEDRRPDGHEWPAPEDDWSAADGPGDTPSASGYYAGGAGEDEAGLAGRSPDGTHAGEAPDDEPPEGFSILRAATLFATGTDPADTRRPAPVRAAHDDELWRDEPAVAAPTAPATPGRRGPQHRSSTHNRRPMLAAALSAVVALVTAVALVTMLGGGGSGRDLQTTATPTTTVADTAAPTVAPTPTTPTAPSTLAPAHTAPPSTTPWPTAAPAPAATQPRLAAAPTTAPAPTTTTTAVVVTTSPNEPTTGPSTPSTTTEPTTTTTTPTSTTSTTSTPAPPGQ